MRSVYGEGNIFIAFSDKNIDVWLPNSFLWIQGVNTSTWFHVLEHVESKSTLFEKA